MGDNSKALNSLALMETKLLSNDYLSTFLPFIATLVLEKKYQKIDISVLVPDFQAVYGIAIPHAPMKSILSKAVSNKLIELCQDGTYQPNMTEIQKVSFHSEKKKSELEIKSVLNKFIEYVDKEHKVKIDYDTSVEMFMNFMDMYSPKTLSGEYYDDMVSVPNKNLYLMGDFIQNVVENDVAIFDIIRKLSMAHIIATALTFDEPVSERISGFQELTIYLDTPIILRLLGLQTEELEKSYKEMFDNYKLLINPEFKIFSHTFDELTGIINDCEKWIENSEYNPQLANPALLNFVKKNYNRTQIELYKNSLKDKLKSLEICVDEVDYYDLVSKNAQINSENLEEQLVRVYKENNPNYDENHNAVSIQYDIHSIENIVKLWGRKSSRTYSKLGSVFLTSNSTLAYVCRKYTSNYWWDNKNHKSPCITDYYLGTMLWLSTPTEKMENVCKLKLLADCSAATTLSREVMAKFVYELERLKENNTIEGKDYLLLRQYAYEKNYLQKITLNEENAFKDDSIDQLLESIKIDIQKPLQEEIQVLKENNRLLDETVEAFKLEAQEKDNLEKESEKNISMKAERCFKNITKLGIPLFTAFFAFVAGILQVTSWFDPYDSIIKIIALCISLLSAVFLAIVKCNVFGFKDKIIKHIVKHYKIKNYKENLK